jgi:hypothetical protein
MLGKPVPGPLRILTSARARTYSTVVLDKGMVVGWAAFKGCGVLIGVGAAGPSPVGVADEVGVGVIVGVAVIASRLGATVSDTWSLIWK